MVLFSTQLVRQLLVITSVNCTSRVHALAVVPGPVLAWPRKVDLELVMSKNEIRMGTDLKVAKVWMMKERRQLLVDILVEGINSSSFTGTILQDTFQLAEAGLYWILLLSSGV